MTKAKLVNKKSETDSENHLKNEANFCFKILKNRLGKKLAEKNWSSYLDTIVKNALIVKRNLKNN